MPKLYAKRKFTLSEVEGLNAKSGFTIFEILIAVAIIAIIAASGYFFVGSNVRARARDAQKITDVDSIKLAVEDFYEKKNKYPPTGAAYNTQTIFTSDIIPSGATDWIPELVPAFAKLLPKDPQQTASAPPPATNQITTIDAAAEPFTYNDIVMGNDNLPIIAYKSGGLKVHKCANSSCTSGTTTLVDNAGDLGYFPSIAIASDGNPFISYFNQGSGDLNVVKCNDPACSGNDETITRFADVNYVAWGTAAAITPSDNLPLVAYWDQTDNDLDVLKCANPNCTSGTVTTIDSAGDVGAYPAIAIAGGLPIIAYRDITNTSLKIARCADVGCTSSSTITADDNGNVGEHNSIAIASDGLPIISYYNPQGNSLKVAKCANVNCTTSQISNVTQSGAFTSIAVPSDGLPVISAWNGIPGQIGLMLIKCNDAACNGANETVNFVEQTGNDIGRYSSIAVDSANLPIITYLEQIGFGTSKVKVAKCAVPDCSSPPPASPSPTPAKTYLYFVSLDRKSANVWAYLENEKDERINTNPAAQCKATPPPEVENKIYNYCGTF